MLLHMCGLIIISVQERNAGREQKHWNDPIRMNIMYRQKAIDTPHAQEAVK